VTDPDPTERWVLTLYVSGSSPRSSEAIENVRRVCDEELAGRVDLDIIDVNEHPALVVDDHILAAPTLVKRLPAPLRRLIGDLSDPARVRLGLDLGSGPTDHPLQVER
jgi:circadian clock protein KaiB